MTCREAQDPPPKRPCLGHTSARPLLAATSAPTCPRLVPNLSLCPGNLGGGHGWGLVPGACSGGGQARKGHRSFSTLSEALPGPGLLRTPIQTQSRTWNFQNKNSKATVERFFFFLNDRFRNFVRMLCF